MTPRSFTRTAIGATPVGHMTNNECKEQQTENYGHCHLDVAVGVFEFHQQPDDVVAQRYPERDGADGKEAGGERRARLAIL